MESERSDSDRIVLVSVAVLFVGSTSVFAADGEAVAVTVNVPNAEGLTNAVNEKVTVPPGGTVTFVAMPPMPLAVWQVAPPAPVHDHTPSEAFPGSGTETEAFVAVARPAL